MPYRDREAQRAYQRTWVARRRAVFFKDKRCEWCAETDGLELHHRNPDRKVSHNIWSWGEKRRQTEIDKCVVLCGGCHSRAHGQARRLEAELRNPHGSVRRYWTGCRCQPCRDAKREYNREHPGRRAA